MGLHVSIYRSDYDCDLNVFYGKKGVTITNVEGPFRPSDDFPAAIIKDGYTAGSKIIVPADDYSDGVQANGGTFASSSDSRFRQAAGTYNAVPIHDRRETWSEYERYSR
jgi:hypothetical protein